MNKSNSKSKKKNNAPVKKGESVKLQIESLAPGGQGVAKLNGFPIFVDRVAPQDSIEAEVYDQRKSFALAKTVKLLEPGPGRAEPVCPVFDRCGGCQWQHLSYAAQLEAKKEIVTQTLERIGGLDKTLVQEPLGAKHQIRYRNKVQFPVSISSKDGNLCAGYYEKNSHRLVDIDSCPVQPEDLDHMLACVKDACREQQLSVYDENTHDGLLRHIILRRSDANKEVLLTLVVNLKGTEELDDPLLKRFKTVAAKMMGTFPQVAGFCLNFNATRGNRILSDQTVCLVGSAVIEEVLQSKRYQEKRLRFRLSTNSFFQIHSDQTTVLLDKIREEIGELNKEAPPVVVDAYAGVGTIAMWLADGARTVYAIEENRFAVADGRNNVLLNGITNIDFREGKVEAVLQKLQEDGIEVDILVLDPPRKGLSESVIDSVLKIGPDKLIYVSCNPSTLARDLKKLEAGEIDESGREVDTAEGNTKNSGYKTVRVTPLDMFPQTYHVESVACLVRKNSDGSFRNLEKI